jgi:hypothetical protein
MDKLCTRKPNPQRVARNRQLLARAIDQLGWIVAIEQLLPGNQPPHLWRFFSAVRGISAPSYDDAKPEEQAAFITFLAGRH